MHFTFSDDLNIYVIYKDVLEILGKYMRHKEAYQRECVRLRMIIDHTHNPSDRIKARHILRSMERLLSMVKDGSLADSYRKQAMPHLSKYMTLSGTSRIFGVDKCTNVPMRVGTIYLFLQVTKQYVDITWECRYNMNKVCPCCFSSMKKCGTVMMCDSCSHSHIITKTLGIRIDDNIMSMESTYDAPKNFRKEYMHVCGIIHDVSDDEEEDIRSYIYRAGFKHISRENIRDSIRACGYSNYHDINYIYSLITKEPLPPIYDQMDKCIARFEKYFRIFHSITDKEGSNITGIHFLIKLFLWQEGVHYEDEWFRSLSEPTERKHKRNARKICDILRIQDSDTNWKIPLDW